MLKLNKVRRDNLLKLLEKAPNKKVFAETCGITKTQLSTFISPTKPDNIGNKIARRIEAGNKLPEYWLDTPKDGEMPAITDSDILKICYSAIQVSKSLSKSDIEASDVLADKLDHILLIAAKQVLIQPERTEIQLSIPLNTH